MSPFEIISDYSKANLKNIPETILEMVNLKMLFLERNLLVRLPDNFFDRLPNLMWLDLRNNQLEELPKSIAHHEHLEHLLLTNNNLRELPNELGLLTNLKALQVADNPLVYPPKKTIQEGTKAIKKFLKEEYEIECTKKVEMRRTIEQQQEIQKELFETQEFLEQEKLIRVFSDVPSNRSKISSADNCNHGAQNLNTRTIDQIESNKSANQSTENFQHKLSDPYGFHSSLHVKKIDYPNKKPEEPIKIVHSVSKGPSRISLKSYIQKSAVKNSLSKIPENILKEGWLNKLRILLNDQERILQQERNLRALSSWRQKQPVSNSKVFYDSDALSRLSETPYATYPEYSSIPSRKDLASQLQLFLTETEMIKSRPKQTSQINLDKVINDLMQQLKEMESNENVARSPRSEMERAGNQIQTIMDIHRKLLRLKAVSESSM
ncbi:hypothetical protein ABEB36_008991 [Hypothenemus hampei]|uniref:Leucine-rich repeat-containing protein 27 n=1 Tax=Hypothenemus hampei TaxID=57062 RepID=A0ABD1ESR4_HYPHA